MNTKRKLLLFISGIALILLFTIMNTNTVKAAVTWPITSFATWTQGRRSDGILTRNKYGFIIIKMKATIWKNIRILVISILRYL